MTDEKADLLFAEIGDLGTSLSESIAKLSDRESYDKDLSKGIQDGFGKLIEAIGKVKQIDLKPVVNIASDISKQNGSIMDMVGRLIHNQDNSEMIKLVTDMVKRNNEFTAQVLKQTDYSETLKSISDNLKNANTLIESFSIKRDGNNNLIDKVIVNYKTIINGR